MKRILSILTIVWCVFLAISWISVAEAKTYIYHAFKGGSPKLERKTTVTIKELPNNEKLIIRKTKGEDCEIIDELIVDKEYTVKNWERTCKGEGTKYLGKKEGKAFLFEGQLRKKIINKEITIGSKPFYVFPKYSLTKFAFSPMKSLKFNIVRRDKLSRLSMQAKNRGEETVEVNGEEVDAINVYYSAPGPRAKFYNRNYYYRKSDGIFVKQTESDGSYEILVEEK